MTNLDLQPVHIKYKKLIGKKGANPIHEILTTGGLYIEVMGKGAGFEVIGTGPHRGVARHIAEHKCPGIEWTELAKGEYVPPEHYMHLVPAYLAYTNAVIERKKQRDEQGNR